MLDLLLTLGAQPKLHFDFDDYNNRIRDAINSSKLVLKCKTEHLLQMCNALDPRAYTVKLSYIKLVTHFDAAYYSDLPFLSAKHLAKIFKTFSAVSLLFSAFKTPQS